MFLFLFPLFVSEKYKYFGVFRLAGGPVTTGNVVIVVSHHSASRYVRLIRGLFERYPSVVLVARGRHVSRLAEVLRRLRKFADIRDSDVSFADFAPEFTVVLSRREGGGRG